MQEPLRPLASRHDRRGINKVGEKGRVGNGYGTRRGSVTRYRSRRRAERDDGIISGLPVHTIDGYGIVPGTTFVDARRDADIAAYAGVLGPYRTRKGRA